MLRRSLLLGAASLVASAASAQVFRPGQLPNSRAGFRILGNGDEPEVSAFADRLTTAPSVAERARLNTLVAGLKADGVWPLLDRLGLLAGETQQAGLRDLRNPAKVLSINGTVTFTADRGFTGDGSTGFLDTGEVLNASGNQYALNSGCVGVWCNAEGSVGLKAHVGNSATATRTNILARRDSGNETFLANDATADVFMSGSTTRLGHRAFSRTAAGVKRGFYNGNLVADLTTASLAINSVNLTLLRSASIYSDDRLSAYYTGAGLPNALISALHNRLSTYLSSKGAA